MKKKTTKKTDSAKLHKELEKKIKEKAPRKEIEKARKKYIDSINYK